MEDVTSTSDFWLENPLSRICLKAILSGNVAKVQSILDYIGENETLSLYHDFYANVNTKAQYEALTLLMNHKKFRFNAGFLCACSYWSPPKFRAFVFRHPRARPYILNPSLLESEYTQLVGGRLFSPGLNDRLVWGLKGLNEARVAHNKRLAFVLYPFLVSWSRTFVEEYYAPGGKAFLKAKERFEAGVKA